MALSAGHPLKSTPSSRSPASTRPPSSTPTPPTPPPRSPIQGQPSSSRQPLGRASQDYLLPQRQTPAEAYAKANTPMTASASKPSPRIGASLREGKENATAGASPSVSQSRAATKPLFDWISRKLGAGRKGTGPFTDLPSPRPPNAAYVNGTRGGSNAQGRAVPGPSRGHVNVNVPPGPRGHNEATQPGWTQYYHQRRKSTASSNLFAKSRTDSSALSRSESHSMRSYSLSYANSIERERRREANNPYPSIPVPVLRNANRESTIDSVSLSYLSRSHSNSRSETPSLRSESSRPRLRDDTSSYRWTIGGADEDASIRPFPPSHPSSPTPSHSVLSRSASASLLSPGTMTQARPPSLLSRGPNPRRSYSSLSTSLNDDIDEIHERTRQDSTSTKPTTITSFDSGPHIAHIAQAHSNVSPATPASPATPSSPVHRGSSSITSRRHSHPNQSPSKSTRTGAPGSPIITPSSPAVASPTLYQAPRHSNPHPRDNPHPSSPPDPNASTLTLASSTFAVQQYNSGSMPHTPNVPTPGIYSPTTYPVHAAHGSGSGSNTPRIREVAIASPLPTAVTAANANATATATATAVRPPSIISPSVTFAPETIGDRPVQLASPTSTLAHEYPPSIHGLSIQGHNHGYTPREVAPSVSLSVRTGGWRGGGVADNASVRAVRRKGSWESYESRWSWKGQGERGASGAGAGPGPSRMSGYGYGEEVDPLLAYGGSVYGPSQRDSVVTSNSYMTAQSRVSRGSRGGISDDGSPVLISGTPVIA